MQADRSAGCAPADGAAIGLLVIHGIGRQEAGYSQPFEAALRRRMRSAGLPADRVAVEPCLWQDLVQERQDAYRQAVRADSLRVGWLRRFVLDNLADPVMYLTPGRPKHISIQAAIHERIKSALERLESRVRAAAPLLILAHSFGGTVMSDYIWNQQQRERKSTTDNRQVYGDSSFSSCGTLAGIITIGCNLPLFVIGVDPYVPIALPARCGAAPWLNLFAAADPLGWPLRALAPMMSSTDAATFLQACEDRVVSVGRWPLSRTALSHQAYWTAEALLQPLLQSLRVLGAI